MKYLMLGLVAMLATGQGCPVPTAPKPDPLAVNDTLRSACAYLNDNEIRTALIAVQTDREGGYTKQQELAIGNSACANTQCQVCTSAVVEQIYRD